MKEPEHPLNGLTALDWIAVLLVCAGALFCFLFPFLIAPRFAKMFSDFGGIVQKRFTHNVSEKVIEIRRDLIAAGVIDDA